MEKKSMIIMGVIIIVIILIAFMGVSKFSSTESSDSSTVRVGNVNFKIPEGFHEEDNDKSTDIKLTDGKHSILLNAYNGRNATAYAEEYLNSQNSSAKFSNFTIGDKIVYRVANNSSGSVNYWYAHNDKVYKFSTWGSYDKSDSTVISLIESMNSTST